MPGWSTEIRKDTLKRIWKIGSYCPHHSPTKSEQLSMEMHSPHWTKKVKWATNFIMNIPINSPALCQLLWAQVACSRLLWTWAPALPSCMPAPVALGSTHCLRWLMHHEWATMNPVSHHVPRHMFHPGICQLPKLQIGELQQIQAPIALDGSCSTRLIISACEPRFWVGVSVRLATWTQDFDPLQLVVINLK